MGEEQVISTPIDVAFEKITSILAGGYTHLHFWITNLLIFVFFVDVIFLAFRWATGQGDLGKDTMNKFITYGFWTLVIAIFPDFMRFIQNMFAEMGVAAGGGDTIIQKPFTIILNGMTNAKPLLDVMGQCDLLRIGDSFFYLICWVGMMLCYVIMTVTFIVTYLEFSVLIGVGGVLLPFGIIKESRFIAEKMLGSAAGHGIKILLLNFIITTANTVMFEQETLLIIQNKSIDVDAILTSITMALLFMVLANSIPQMATGILSGSPTLSNGNAMPAIMGAGMLAAGAAKIAPKLLQAGSKGAVTGIGGIANAAGAAKNAMSSYMQNAEIGSYQSGKQPTVGAMMATGLKTGLGSLGKSAIGTLGKGAHYLWHSAMHGKGAARFADQRGAAESVGQMGSARNFISHMYNKGKGSGDKIGFNAVSKPKAFESNIDQNIPKPIESLSQPNTDGKFSSMANSLTASNNSESISSNQINLSGDKNE